jgi:hypothetical protein
MDLWLEAALNPSVLSEYRRNHLSAQPSTLNVIESVRFRAFAPPSPPLIDTVSEPFLGV